MNTEKERDSGRSGSAIIRWLHRLTARFCALVLSSFLGRLFTGYGRAQDTFAKGLTNRVMVGHHNRSDRWLFRLRLLASSVIERSALSRGSTALCNCLLRCSMSTYGVFCFFFGCYSTVAYLLHALFSPDTAPTSFLVTGVLMIGVALPLFASGKSLAHTLGTGVVSRGVLLHALGIPSEKLDSPARTGEEHYFAALMVAVGCGLLTLLIPPYAIPLGILLAVVIRVILQYPEVGMLLSVASAPLLTLLEDIRPTAVLLCLVGLTAVGYVFKIICGKRVFRMELQDYSILFFMFLTFMGGVITEGGIASLRSALSYCVLMLIYWLAANLVRSAAWMRRMIAALVGGCIVVALLGLWQHFFGNVTAQYLDLSLFSDLGGRVTSTMENPNMLAEYLILILPFALGVMISRRRLLHGFGAFVCVGVIAACLIYTWSRGAWLGALISLILFVVLLGYRSQSVALLCLIPGAAALHYLPETVIRRFTSIGSTADTSIRYRTYLWEGVGEMLRDHWFSGVGVGEQAFCEIYTRYALPGIESAVHSHSLYLQLLCSLGVFGLLAFLLAMILFFCNGLEYVRRAYDRASRIPVLAGICGAVALLVMGLTDDVFYNYRVFFLFWSVIGLTTAQIRIGYAARAHDEPDTVNTKTGSDVVLYFHD